VEFAGSEMKLSDLEWEILEGLEEVLKVSNNCLTRGLY
jgi:hypothetical protein